MGEGGKAQARQSRQHRLRAALRENLRRRKAQARGRGAGAEEAEADSAERIGENTDIKGEP